MQRVHSAQWASARWRSPASPVATAWRNASPGLTLPVAMCTADTTGVRSLSTAASAREVPAQVADGSVRCADRWGPTCPYGWAVSLRSTWMQVLPPTLLFPAATCAQRGRQSIGLRHRCHTGPMPSSPYAHSAPRL